MKYYSNVTEHRAITPRLPGLVLGSLGVLAFSFSLPATKLALDGLDPWLVAFARAAVAGLLAIAYLAAVSAPRPTPGQWTRVAVVAGAAVIGFPLFTSLALTTSGSAHGAIVISILPAATALAAVVRAGERPGPAFWLAASAGLAVVLGFVVHDASGAPTFADAFLLAGTVCSALGYAEGGALARELGGARTISWALVVSLPLTIPVTAVAAAATPVDPHPTALLGLAYVAAVSMFLGFFAWYAGLARGGVARVGQLQLTQPLLTLVWSALVLGESLTPVTLLAAIGVLASVVATQRASVAVAPHPTRDPASRARTDTEPGGEEARTRPAAAGVGRCERAGGPERLVRSEASSP
jgi:drug/metabolite transporter (DMT)-like permease